MVRQKTYSVQLTEDERKLLQQQALACKNRSLALPDKQKL